MTITTDQLIDSGILEEIPSNYQAEQFCLAVSVQFLGGVANMGATLLRVDSRGSWAHLGGYLDLQELGEQLAGQRSTSFPVLMNAIRNEFTVEALGSESFEEMGFSHPGYVQVLGFSRPHFGVLILGATEPLDLSSGAKKLIVSVTEKWLSRNDSPTVHTTTIPQVNSDNSDIIFTARQLEVLALLGEGMTNTQVGKALSISASLAKQEVAFLSHALQAKNRLDVVVKAQRQGILPVGRH